MIHKKMIAVLLCLCTMLCVFCGCSSAPAAENTNTEFEVVSYVVASNIQSPDSLHAEDFDIITTVILFGCVTFDEAGEVHADTSVLETALANLRNCIGERDVKITLNLLGPGPSEYTDWNDQMAKLALLHNEAFASGKLEGNIKALIEKYDFDGVHFDYEYPISKDAWKAFNKFLVKLDKQMPNRTIGVAVSTWDVGLNKKAVAAVDSIELMLYDHYDDNGRHSTYETAVGAAEAFKEKKIPLSKVHFGLPFYARPTDSDAYWYGYNGYFDKLDENGFYYDESIGKTFWFNTPDVIADKTQYALDNGFGGVMIWHYSCDLPSSDADSLLGAIGKIVQ